MGPAPWIYVLVYSPTDQIALICQRPGEGCRKHMHVTHAEWWIVLEGAFEWRLGDGRVFQTTASDVVCLPRGMPHQIACTSPTPGIRLACGARDMEHVYVR
jgi:quercetin dioxygenase-like cupin family protein